MDKWSDVTALVISGMAFAISAITAWLTFFSCGRLIENLYMRFTRGKSIQNLSGWFYGETNKLFVGGGLSVDSDYGAANHHFVLSLDHHSFVLQSGSDKHELYGNIVEQRRTSLLFSADIVWWVEFVSVLRALGCGRVRPGL